MYGGEGTYMARALLKMLIDDNELLNTFRYKKPEFYTHHSKNISIRNNFFYPNPANSVIYLNIPERNDKNIKIQINDYLDRELMSYHLSSLDNQINIDYLKNGIYFINVVQDGKKLRNGKIIVLH